MMFNIIVGVLAVLAIVVGVFAWKLENGGSEEEEENDEKLEGIADSGKNEK